VTTHRFVTNLCVDHATLSVLHNTAVACGAARNSHWSASRTCTQLSLVSVTNLHATLTGQRHEPVCRPRNSLCFTHNSRCVCGAAATTQQSLVRGAAAGHERERETERESLCVYQKRFVVKGGKTSKKFALDNPLVNLESVISFGFVGLSCSF